MVKPIDLGNVKTYIAPNGTGAHFIYDERDLVKQSITQQLKKETQNKTNLKNKVRRNTISMLS